MSIVNSQIGTKTFIVREIYPGDVLHQKLKAKINGNFDISK